MILVAKVMMLVAGFALGLMVVDDAHRVGADGFHWSLGLFAVALVFVAGAL